MKKVIYESFGNPVDVLRLVETDSPPLGPGQARVCVLRAPINPSDLIQVSGNYGIRPTLPAVPGNEGLGRVVETRGDGLAEGQLVLLPGGQGTWRTEMVCDMAALVPVPDGDLDQLAMLRINPATAQLLLSEFVDLRAGDWIVQSAANSGVGSYLRQLARQAGIKVVNVVRRQEALDALGAGGAEVVLLDGPDLAQRVRDATGAEMKLAVDAVAGETFARLAATLTRGGSLVSYGGMSNRPCAVDAFDMIFRDLRLRGFWLVHWFERTAAEARRTLYADLTRAVIAGTLHAPVDRHFPLEDIAAAARYSWKGEREGKVMLAPNGV